MKSIRTCRVLISEGYADKSIARTIEFLRLNDVKVSFLHLFVSPLIDELFVKFGIESELIGDLGSSPLPDGLLFAGGEKCAQHFLIDPRVYRFVRQMHQRSKPIGYLYPIATPLVVQFRESYSDRPLLLQGKLRPHQFFADFIKHLPQVITPVYSSQTAALLL